MGKIESPAVIASTQLTVVSTQTPGGAPQPAAKLQIQAVRRNAGGHIEEVHIPALHMTRAQLQELIETLGEMLQTLGGPVPEQPPMTKQ